MSMANERGAGNGLSRPGPAFRRHFLKQRPCVRGLPRGVLAELAGGPRREGADAELISKHARRFPL
jgi:hypothetical protein